MRNLVSIVLCAVIGYSYAALTAEQGATLGGWQDACFKKTGISIETLMGGMAAVPVAVDIKGHMMCLAITAKLLEPDETYNEAKMTAELLAFDNNPGKVNDVIVKCRNTDTFALVACIFVNFAS